VERAAWTGRRHRREAPLKGNAPVVDFPMLSPVQAAVLLQVRQAVVQMLLLLLQAAVVGVGQQDSGHSRAVECASLRQLGGLRPVGRKDDHSAKSLKTGENLILINFAVYSTSLSVLILNLKR
jgi:hypothetical protein